MGRADDPDPLTRWAHDFAVPRGAKRPIRRALARLADDVRGARGAPTLDSLHEALHDAGARFAEVVNRTDERADGWVETVNREDLYDAVAAVVRDGVVGFRGNVELLVESCHDGIESTRDW